MLADSGMTNHSNQHEALQKRIAVLTSELSSSISLSEALADSLQRMQQHKEREEKRAAALENAFQECKRQLDIAAAARQQSVTEVQEHHSTISRLQRELQFTNAQQATLTKELDGACRKLASMQAVVERTEKAAAEEISAAIAERDHAIHAMQTMRAQLLQLTSNADSVQETNIQLVAENSSLQQQLDKALQMLEESQRTQQSLIAENASLKQANSSIRTSWQQQAIELEGAITNAHTTMSTLRSRLLEAEELKHAAQRELAASRSKEAAITKELHTFKHHIQRSFQGVLETLKELRTQYHALKHQQHSMRHEWSSLSTTTGDRIIQHLQHCLNMQLQNEVAMREMLQRCKQSDTAYAQRISSLTTECEQLRGVIANQTQQLQEATAFIDELQTEGQKTFQQLRQAADAATHATTVNEQLQKDMAELHVLHTQQLQRTSHESFKQGQISVLFPASQLLQQMKDAQQNLRNTAASMLADCAKDVLPLCKEACKQYTAAQLTLIASKCADVRDTFITTSENIHAQLFAYSSSIRDGSVATALIQTRLKDYSLEMQRKYEETQQKCDELAAALAKAEERSQEKEEYFQQQYNSMNDMMQAKHELLEQQRDAANELLRAKDEMLEQQRKEISAAQNRLITTQMEAAQTLQERDELISTIRTEAKQALEDRDALAARLDSVSAELVSVTSDANQAVNVLQSSLQCVAYDVTNCCIGAMDDGFGSIAQRLCEMENRLRAANSAMDRLTTRYKEVAVEKEELSHTVEALRSKSEMDDERIEELQASFNSVARDFYEFMYAERQKPRPEMQSATAAGPDDVHTAEGMVDMIRQQKLLIIDLYEKIHRTDDDYIEMGDYYTRKVADLERELDDAKTALAASEERFTRLEEESRHVSGGEEEKTEIVATLQQRLSLAESRLQHYEGVEIPRLQGELLNLSNSIETLRQQSSAETSQQTREWEAAHQAAQDEIAQLKRTITGLQADSAHDKEHISALQHKLDAAVLEREQFEAESKVVKAEAIQREKEIEEASKKQLHDATQRHKDVEEALKKQLHDATQRQNESDAVSVKLSEELVKAVSEVTAITAAIRADAAACEALLVQMQQQHAEKHDTTAFTSVVGRIRTFLEDPTIASAGPFHETLRVIMGLLQQQWLQNLHHQQQEQYRSRQFDEARAMFEEELASMQLEYTNAVLAGLQTLGFPSPDLQQVALLPSHILYLCEQLQLEMQQQNSYTPDLPAPFSPPPKDALVSPVSTVALDRSSLQASSGPAITMNTLLLSPEHVRNEEFWLSPSPRRTPMHTTFAATASPQAQQRHAGMMMKELSLGHESPRSPRSLVWSQIARATVGLLCMSRLFQEWNENVLPALPPADSHAERDFTACFDYLLEKLQAAYALLQVIENVENKNDSALLSHATSLVVAVQGAITAFCRLVKMSTDAGMLADDQLERLVQLPSVESIEEIPWLSHYKLAAPIAPWQVTQRGLEGITFHEP